MKINRFFHLLQRKKVDIILYSQIRILLENETCLTNNCHTPVSFKIFYFNFHAKHLENWRWHLFLLRICKFPFNKLCYNASIYQLLHCSVWLPLSCQLSYLHDHSLHGNCPTRSSSLLLFSKTCQPLMHAFSYAGRLQSSTAPVYKYQQV